MVKRANGEGTITGNGYRKLSVKNGVDHVQQYEHILIIERILGRVLPPGAEIHHVNEIKTDNRNCNLVVCPSSAYHLLLHRRTRAYDACGHADWRKCCYCKQYDVQINMKDNVVNGGQYHRECMRLYMADRYRRGLTPRQIKAKSL